MIEIMLTVLLHMGGTLPFGRKCCTFRDRSSVLGKGLGVIRYLHKNAFIIDLNVVSICKNRETVCPLPVAAREKFCRWGTGKKVRA